MVCVNGGGGGVNLDISPGSVLLFSFTIDVLVFTIVLEFAFLGGVF